jgi:putative ABC transport system permease protein
MTGLRLAWLSLMRRKAGTAVVVFCLALAALASSALVTLLRPLHGSLYAINTGFEIIVGPKSSRLGILLGSAQMWNRTEDIIPFSIARALNHLIEPEHIVPLLTFAEYEKSPVIATDDHYFDRPRHLPKVRLRAGQWFEGSGQAVVGVEAAKRLGFEPGDQLTIQAAPSAYQGEEPFWEETLEVSGIFEDPQPTRNEAILVSMGSGWDYYRQALAEGFARETQNNQATTYLLVSTTPEKIDETLRLLQRNSVAQAIDARSSIHRLQKMLARGESVLTLLCACVVALAAFGLSVLINTRYEALRPELGLLRALGYSRWRVASWMLWEAVLIAVMSVIASVVIEWLLFLLAAGQVEALRDVIWPSGWNIAVWAGLLLAAILAAVVPLGRLYIHNVQTSMRGL